MTVEHESLSKKILSACDRQKRKLKPVANEAGVSYIKLYQQIRRGSPIPFETVEALAHTLNLPIEYFSVSSPTSHGIWFKSGPDIADFRRRLTEVDYQIDELGEIGAYIDVYDAFDTTHSVPIAEAFGRKSLARLELGLTSKQIYFDRLTSFDEGIRNRSTAAHQRANYIKFQIDEEEIDTLFEGKRVSGCYFRGLARGTDRLGAKKTAVFTQLVSRSAV
ncbi:MAG: hypothetical protein AAF755_10200 [Pseudomonadota bacterium]